MPQQFDLVLSGHWQRVESVDDSTLMCPRPQSHYPLDQGASSCTVLYWERSGSCVMECRSAGLTCWTFPFQVQVHGSRCRALEHFQFVALDYLCLLQL